MKLTLSFMVMDGGLMWIVKKQLNPILKDQKILKSFKQCGRRYEAQET